MSDVSAATPADTIAAEAQYIREMRAGRPSAKVTVNDTMQIKQPRDQRGGALYDVAKYTQEKVSGGWVSKVMCPIEVTERGVVGHVAQSEVCPSVPAADEAAAEALLQLLSSTPPSSAHMAADSGRLRRL